MQDSARDSHSLEPVLRIKGLRSFVISAESIEIQSNTVIVAILGTLIILMSVSWLGDREGQLRKNATVPRVQEGKL